MRKIPRILFDRYELLDVLGGTHGEVYRAIDLLTNEKVAIKPVSKKFDLCIFNILNFEI